jgi:predicted DNA-binding protein
VSRRIVLTITDELAERISRVASHYDRDAKTYIIEAIDDQTAMLEEYHHQEACEQIRYLVQVEPAGSA